MNFNSLVWYSSLAIGVEKNSYVADFLNKSCELINEEINRLIYYKKFQCKNISNIQKSNYQCARRQNMTSSAPKPGGSRRAQILFRY